MININVALKNRTGKECKKYNCVRHESYLKWMPGDDNLQYCMACKHAHVSQYERGYVQAETHCSDWSYMENSP